MRNEMTISRRSMLGGTLASGLVLGLKLGIGEAQAATTEAAPLFDTWVRVGTDGQVNVLVNCIEMGQGAPLGFAQIVADELDADWSTVRIEQAPVEKTYYNVWNIYSTGGSASIRTHFDKLRRAGAAARMMLTQAAAKRWGVPEAECRAELGRITHAGSNRSLGYGEVALDAAQLPVPKEPRLKSREQWRYIGKPIKRIDLQEIVTGKSVYGIDVTMPSLLIATIMQAPVFGAKLLGVDPKPALAVRGVKQVVEIVGGRIRTIEETSEGGQLAPVGERLEDAVVVVATNYWAAQKGLAALEPRWSNSPMARVSSRAISAGLGRALEQATFAYTAPGENEVELRRDVDRRLGSAKRRLKARYEVPLLSQSPLEPMNGTAWVRDGQVELWMPTQVQSQMRDAVASALRMPAEKVTINSTLMGGAFGRRLATDYGVQAALVSQAVKAPVKLIWSRQEDTKHGFYRPAAIAEMEIGIDDPAKPDALRLRMGSMETFASGGDLNLSPYGLGPMLGMEKMWNPGVPVGSWRAVAYVYTNFFLESFIDELAAAAGTDPVAYRRQLIGDNPRMQRMRRVLDAVADAAGWGRAPAGRHQGVAILNNWRSYTAQVVELSVSPDREIEVHKVTCAIDCGMAVNPDQARAQIEGGILYGLGGALAQAITVRNGAVEQSSFVDYPVTVMANAPDIDVVFVDTPDVPLGGIGESPVPPIAPALCNALFRATGTRVRTLPVTSAGFTVGRSRA